MTNDKWKVAEITINPYGPRYLVRGENLYELVDTVEFNEFVVGLDGRAEVEYKSLNIKDGEFSSIAKFYNYTGERPSE